MPATQLTIPEAKTQLETVRGKKRLAIAAERHQEETVAAVSDLLSGLRRQLRGLVKDRRALEDEEEILVSRLGLEA